MRYIKKEHIITTICDDNIEDLTIVRSIIETIHQYKSYCSLTLREKTSEYECSKLFYSDCLVYPVDDNYFYVMTKKSGSFVKKTNISYSDIVELEYLAKEEKDIKVSFVDSTNYRVIDIPEKGLKNGKI